MSYSKMLCLDAKTRKQYVLSVLFAQKCVCVCSYEIIENTDT